MAIRIDDAKPKAILTASGAIEGARILEYKPMLDKAIDLAGHKPEKCIIFQRSFVRAPLFRGRDLDWEKFAGDAQPAECVPVKATDPLYILYTSGTTGVPKGIVRDNGGHAVALRWTLENICFAQEEVVKVRGWKVGSVTGKGLTIRFCNLLTFQPSYLLSNPKRP